MDNLVVIKIELLFNRDSSIMDVGGLAPNRLEQREKDSSSCANMCELMVLLATTTKVLRSSSFPRMILARSVA